MDEKTYKGWWPLHLRAAMGEELNSQEQIEYEAGLHVLDEEEKEYLRSNSLTTLSQLRMQIEQLESAYRQLRNESASLKKKSASLERELASLE